MVSLHRPLGERRFSFPMGFSSENKTIPVGITMDLDGLWVSNTSYSVLYGNPFHCLESKNCYAQKRPTSRHWIDFDSEGSTGGLMIKDAVSFGGLTGSDFEIFLVNNWSKDSSNKLGLSFRDANNIDVLEQLKKNGLISKSLFSISFDKNNEGKLVFGGYPSKKTEADFEFASMERHQLGRPSVKTFGLAFSSNFYTEKNGYEVALDFGDPFLRLLTFDYNRLMEEIDSKGLRLRPPFPAGAPSYGLDGEIPVNCRARTVLEDFVIQVEDFIVKIPASAYIRYGKGFTEDNQESSEEGCFLSVLDNATVYLVLGQPLFRVYDVVFDTEKKRIGFSGKYHSIKTFSQNLFLVCIVLGVISLGVFAYFLMKKSRRSYIPFSGKTTTFGEPSSSAKVNDIDLDDASHL